jgi:RNA polymerase sigma-70 factor (ECF subfamily)
MDDRAGRLARGDVDAFVALYDDCAQRIHRYLSVRLGSQADADDVLQETFVRLARTRQRLASVRNLIAYAFAVARHEASRLIERQEREGRHRKALALPSLCLESRDSDMSDGETVEWVVSCLQTLNEDQREILVMKIYGELTFREISEVTGLPQGTVATRYRAALERLRAQLVKESE